MIQLFKELRVLSAVFATLMIAATVFGQQAARTPGGATAQEANTDQGTAQQESTLFRASVVPSGPQRFAQGSWATLAAVGSNASDQDHEETVSVWFGDDPSMQYATRFWVPPRSRRQTWLPVRIAEDVSESGKRVTMSMARLTEVDGQEAFGDNVNSMPVVERSLMLTDREINSAIIGDVLNLKDDPDRLSERLQDVLDVVNAGREFTTSSDLELPPILFTGPLLPPTYGSLDELDQLVVAGNLLLQDTAGIATVRRWVRDGGRLWIMLDRTDMRLVTELLGNDITITTVDSVERNALEIQTFEPNEGWVEKGVERWSSETPVTMLRVLTDNDDILVRSGEWPLAFWKKMGEGEVLLTTLGAGGWIGEGKVATGALHRLSQRFFESREQPPETANVMVPMLNQRIGYEIPSRSVAGSILFANVVVLLGLGFLWVRQRKLERMAILVPVCSLLSAGGLGFLGNRQASSVASTVAVGQWIRADAPTGEADLVAAYAVYSQKTAELELSTGRSAPLLPITELPDGETYRIIWDDDGGNHWEGLKQPPGVVRHLKSEGTLVLEPPLSMSGTFDQQGFVGGLSGLWSSNADDGVLVTATGPATVVRFAADDDSGIDVRAATSDRLPPNEYLPGGLVSDRQRQRQDFLRRLTSANQSSLFGSTPTLLVWTDPFSLDVDWSDTFQQRGSALVSVPVRVTAPQTGTPFSIPATFVRTEAFFGTRGMSSLLNNQTGQWLENVTKPAETELIFRVPEAVRSMQIKRATIAIKVSAPLRTMVFKTFANGKQHTVFEQKNPTGLIEFSIDDPEVLEMHPEGGLLAVIEITESERSLQQNDVAEPTAPNSGEAGLSATGTTTTWQIDFLNASLDGVLQ